MKIDFWILICSENYRDLFLLLTYRRKAAFTECKDKRTIFHTKCELLKHFDRIHRRWSGGAMALGNLPVPGRPTIWMKVGQGPTVLAVGAGGVVWTFSLSSTLSLLCLTLFGRRSDID